MVSRLTLGSSALALSIATAIAAPRPYDSGGGAHLYRRLDTASQADYHGRYSEELRIVDDVIRADPEYGEAYQFRAFALLYLGRLAEAERDIAILARMHPDAGDMPLMRARVALARHDPELAKRELMAAARLSYRSVWKDDPHELTTYSRSTVWAFLSVAEEMEGHDDAALAAMDKEMTFETDAPWYVLRFHCLAAQQAGVLEMAELTCNIANQKAGRYFGLDDRLGMIHLRLKNVPAALADFERALRAVPDLSTALYGRGVARIALGNGKDGEADIAAAARLEPNIQAIMEQFGVVAA